MRLDYRRALPARERSDRDNAGVLPRAFQGYGAGAGRAHCENTKTRLDVPGGGRRQTNKGPKLKDYTNFPSVSCYYLYDLMG